MDITEDIVITGEKVGMSQDLIALYRAGNLTIGQLVCMQPDVIIDLTK